MICADAVIQPVRVPGAMTLERESMRITRPSTSMLRNEGESDWRYSSWEGCDAGGAIVEVVVV